MDGTTRSYQTGPVLLTQDNGRGPLAESELRYRLLADNSTDVIATSDRKGTLTYVSPAVRRLFGYEPEEVVGRDIFGFTHPEDLPLVANAHKQVLESPESVTLSYRCRRKDGSFVWVEVIARQVCDPGTGEIAEVQSTCRDVSERKKAEDELLSLAQRLEESNRELEQFASVASHDLQEPLHKIRGFGSLLMAKYGELIDTSGRDYLEAIENAALRMQDLIDNLLTLSHVSIGAQPFTSVDLAEAARDVVSVLEISIEETGASVEIADLPTVTGDPLQMRQLLQNLIGNALKFSSRRSRPVVRVYTRGGDWTSGSNRRDTGDLWSIFIEDNGIGFESERSEVIFDVFERLNGPSDYEGTGIGLAICKKIAMRHEGSITATSTPGRGSTFIVTLPA